MFSAFRQLAERTVSSRSSTGRSSTGSICGVRLEAASAADSVPSSAANTDSWSTRMRADWRIASSGEITPSVSMFITSLSRSVRCSTRADSTAYDTRRTGENDASSTIRPMTLPDSSPNLRTLPGT
ncbi:hypothetical protein D3C72_1460900 [compost metagenome]